MPLDSVCSRLARSCAFIVISALVAGFFALVLESQGWLVILAACGFNAASTFCWNILDCLAVEHFPVHMRSFAIAMQSSAGKAGPTIAGFINGK